MEYVESGYWLSGYADGDIVAGENTHPSLYVESGYHVDGYIDGDVADPAGVTSQLYVEDGYWLSGYADGDTQEQVEPGLYVESGYHAEGYAVGDTVVVVEQPEDPAPTPTITATLSFRIDVKKTSIKTKEEVLLIAKAEVETRQGWYDNRVVYADVYDVRDKTITRVFSDLAKANGFADDDSSSFGSGGISAPRIKLVNPFEALVLDTQMVNNSGVYSFAFNTAQIGNGTYHLEVEFVDEDA